MSPLRLAFIISLPRTGSTLLQRLLGAHSRIATVPEPWILLPPLYAIRPEGVFAEYGHRTTALAINALIERLPGGRGDYLAAVAGMAQEIYQKLSPPGAEVFLDKTPRYGLVVDDLIEMFPQATFIVLHRNPLAVVASITDSFTGGHWKPHHHKQDLFLLAERLLAAQEKHPAKFTSVRYEDLIADPTATLRPIVSALGLNWEASVLDSYHDTPVAGVVGDPTGDRYQDLSSEPLTKWRSTLASPLRRRWSRRYLGWLGDQRLELMGYRRDELLRELHSIPTDYSKLGADLINTAKGALWSLGEVEMTRSKLRRLPAWRELFTHT